MAEEMYKKDNPQQGAEDVKKQDDDVIDAEID